MPKYAGCMIEVLAVSIFFRLLALVWSVVLIWRIQDWRMGFLSFMLALMATRQILALRTILLSSDIPVHNWTTELFGLVVSALAFLAIYYLGKFLEERKRKDEALQDYAIHFQSAQTIAKVGSWKLDIKSGTQYWSSEMYPMFHRDPALDVPQPSEFLSYIFPKDRGPVIEAIRLLNLGTSSSLEFRTHPKRGPVRILYSLFDVIRDEKGEPEYLIGVTQDITQRKTQEKEIRRQNKELEGLLEIGKKMAQRVELEELFQFIVSSIVETIPGADAASLWLCDEGDSLSIKASYGHKNEAVAGLQKIDTNHSLLGVVHRNRGFTLIPDTRKEAFFQSLNSPIDQVRSVAGAPLMLERELYGLIFADSYSAPNTLSQKDGRLLQSIASQAVIAIENARLFKHQKEVSRQRLRDQEEERRRIALELHDEIGGQLASLGLSLSLAHEDKEALNMAETVVTTLANSVRSISLDLRPSMLDDLGLVPTLRWFFDRYTRQTGIEVVFYEELSIGMRFSPEFEIVAFRVTQEALTNVARYAGTSSVQVLINRDAENVKLHVIDEGAGFNINTRDNYKSVGITGMRERVSLLGGTLDVASEPGIGTRITATFPFANGEV